MKPTSSRSTVMLAVILAGSLLFVVFSGGRKKHAAVSPAAVGAAASVAAGMPAAGPLGTAPVAVSEEGSATPADVGAGVPDSTFGEDPFLYVPESAPPGSGIAPATPSPAAAAPAPALELQGTAVAEGHSMALISGQYYAPGDEVAGWRLVWITQREVRLTRDGETLTLRMERE